MKILFVFLLLMLSVCFFGCTAVEPVRERVGEEMFLKSGFSTDDDYIEYSNNEITENGFHVDAADYEEQAGEDVPPKDKIHVTFADNQYFDIKYYSDDQMTNEIDTDNCYLYKTEQIYASAISKNPNSNLYSLSEFRIYEYDASGNRIGETITLSDTKGFVFEIPSQFNGSGISIFPIGKYSDRKLYVTAYKSDYDGNKIELAGAGSWVINDEAFSGDSTTISSVVPYILVYTYDIENYFFVSSSPSPFTKDPKNSKSIEFNEVAPNEENQTYEIELRNYLDLAIEISEDATVSINGGEHQTIEKEIFTDAVWSSSKLMFGDEIVIETTGECKITSGEYRHVSATRDELIEDSFRYVFTIEKTASNAFANDLSMVNGIEVVRSFDITLSSIAEHGKCVYELDGEEVSGVITATEGQVLTLTYELQDDDYEFKNDNFFINLTRKDSVTLEVTPILHENTINPDNEFSIVEKEG